MRIEPLVAAAIAGQGPIDVLVNWAGVNAFKRLAETRPETVGAIVAGPLGFPGEPGVLGLALALAGVSLVVLGLALSGRASGLSGFLVLVLTVLTALGAVVARVDVGDGQVGDRAWTPTAVTLPASYALSAGDATLDLGGLTPRTGSGPARMFR